MKMLRRGANVMDSVKVNRCQLISKVRDNLDNHVNEYLEAMEGWKTLAIEVTNYNKDALAFGRDPQKIAPTLKPLPVPPPNYEKEYNRALAMLNMSVDEIIEIDEVTFNQLVLDEWTWKQAFTTTTSIYKK